MTYKQNLHTHTTYVDGRQGPEELIVTALEKGFDSLGFSEHTYLCHSTYPNQMDEDKAMLYRAEIAALKKQYEGKINLFCGLELEYYSDFNIKPYDYIIGSVHYLDCGEGIFTFDRSATDTKEYINRYFGGDGLHFMKKYFETLASYPDKYTVDIIGHFDLPLKHNESLHFVNETSKAYLDLAYGAIHALKGRIPLFEVNTGAVAAGYRHTPYPTLDVMRELCHCGFGAVITSDCHNKDNLDFYFDESRALLREAGFSSHFILTENGFKEVAL